jgi:hypothetical protein
VLAAKSYCGAECPSKAEGGPHEDDQDRISDLQWWGQVPFFFSNWFILKLTCSGLLGGLHVVRARDSIRLCEKLQSAGHSLDPF